MPAALLMEPMNLDFTFFLSVLWESNHVSVEIDQEWYFEFDAASTFSSFGWQGRFIIEMCF